MKAPFDSSIEELIRFSMNLLEISELRASTESRPTQELEHQLREKEITLLVSLCEQYSTKDETPLYHSECDDFECWFVSRDFDA